MTRALISADNHVFEPVTLWQERLPARFRDRGPRLETRGDWYVMAIEGMPDRKLTRTERRARPRARQVRGSGHAVRRSRYATHGYATWRPMASSPR